MAERGHRAECGRWETRLVELCGALTALGVLAMILMVPGGLAGLLSYRALAFLPDEAWAALFGAAAAMQVACVLIGHDWARVFAAMVVGSLFSLVAVGIAYGPTTPSLALAFGEVGGQVVCIFVLIRRNVGR